MKDFDDLADWLKQHKESESSYDRIEEVIFGEEVPWQVIKEYFKL